MNQEIGSEYHNIPADKGNGFTFHNDHSLVFSGRTAIETILKEIPNAKKALLPSYCCESMIIPFYKAGIEVLFYDVFYANGINIKFDNLFGIDVILWCNYFGFKNEMPDFTYFIGHGGIVIEDITHSIMSERQYHKQSHYLVASLRKWMPIICGGYCASLNGQLQHFPDVEPPREFISKKKKAMQFKSDYLCEHDESIKVEFLRLFGESNSWLAKNYSGLSIDPWSRQYLSFVDIEAQRKIRRDNASVLYNGLRDKVLFLFSEKDMDCPLFVPILLPEKRDAIRKHLSSNSIYCPIHWPKPQECESNLYDMELSLICDQRYNVKDMERIVSVLNKVL